ncbi:hypothetical protein PG991_010228 [Apiospora marii]|uniref:Uncharacterized protein n=1 Tax=Apiospora marii TaxID=335849 RepID=A0ABR1RI67_9PEZI
MTSMSTLSLTRDLNPLPERYAAVLSPPPPLPLYKPGSDAGTAGDDGGFRIVASAIRWSPCNAGAGSKGTPRRSAGRTGTGASAGEDGCGAAGRWIGG